MSSRDTAVPFSFSAGSEENESLYRTRLAAVFRALALTLFAFSLILILVLLAVPAARERMFTIPHIVSSCALPVCIGAWWAFRSTPMSTKLRAWAELVITVVAMGMNVTPTAFDASDERAELSAMLLFMFLLSLRAGLLPATPRWTLVVSVASAVPLFVASILHSALAGGNYAGAIIVVIWCTAGIAGARTVSRVTTALRKEVKDARKLGQYTLEEKLGEGGMGVVYRARHALLRRPAAIKLLLPDRASEEDVARFEREVQITSRLTHPNTVSIFDFGRTMDRGFYYVMELLDGLDLERLVEEFGPIPAPRVIHILAQASGALHEAHLLGLVHRDIKPANIILTERTDEPDVVKVVDFGLVKTMDRATDEGNLIMGTPGYIAPESIMTGTTDARADLYALGAVGYYLLSGHEMFEPGPLTEMFRQHMFEGRTPPSKRAGIEIADDLERLILQCIDADPQKRPASADALRRALLSCRDASRYDATDARAWWAGRRRTSPPPMPSTPPVVTVKIDARVIES